MEAPVCDRWNVLIPTPINGACVHRCQRGGEEWVWPHITVSCMQWEDMTHQLQAIVRVCQIVWRGKLPRHNTWEERNPTPNYLHNNDNNIPQKQAVSLGRYLWVPNTIICTFICKCGHTLLHCEITVTLLLRNVVESHSNSVIWR